jgi:uncharacterized Fe-S cluster protein YjdI
MEEKRKYYKSDKITVSFNMQKCIHAAECANGLPEVFDPNKRPWVNPDGAEVNRIKEVIERCPSGALKYELPENNGNEEPVQNAEITIIPDGPLYIRGDIEIRSADGEIIGREYRAALCRCGHSNSKPFCDNSHIKETFSAE